MRARAFTRARLLYHPRESQAISGWGAHDAASDAAFRDLTRYVP